MQVDERRNLERISRDVFLSKNDIGIFKKYAGMSVVAFVKEVKVD